ncbi:unnamed protein product [Closterium sp. Yama58-4]|nr:unnamed protein product [Closterium sp. Yama58-4]
MGVHRRHADNGDRSRAPIRGIRAHWVVSRGVGKPDAVRCTFPSAPSSPQFLPVRASLPPRCLLRTFRNAVPSRPRLPRCSCSAALPSALLLLLVRAFRAAIDFASARSALLLLPVSAFRGARASRPRLPRCSFFPSAPSAQLLLPVRAFRAALASRPHLTRCDSFPSAPYALRFLAVLAFRNAIPSLQSLRSLSSPVRSFPSWRSLACPSRQRVPVRAFLANPIRSRFPSASTSLRHSVPCWCV